MSNRMTYLEDLLKLFVLLDAYNCDTMHTFHGSKWIINLYEEGVSCKNAFLCIHDCHYNNLTVNDMEFLSLKGFHLSWRHV